MGTPNAGQNMPFQRFYAKNLKKKEKAIHLMQNLAKNGLTVCSLFALCNLLF